MWSCEEMGMLANQIAKQMVQEHISELQNENTKENATKNESLETCENGTMTRFGGGKLS